MHQGERILKAHQRCIFAFVCPEGIRLGIILVVSGKHALNDRHLLLHKLQAFCFNKIFINRLEIELTRLFTIFQEDINPKAIIFKKST